MTPARVTIATLAVALLYLLAMGGWLPPLPVLNVGVTGAVMTGVVYGGWRYLRPGEPDFPVRDRTPDRRPR